MLKIGITGGIGSGKTTIAKIFHSMGVPVFNADDEAKKILSGNEIVHRKIKIVFGKRALDGNGSIDKKKLAKLVFVNEGALQKLNQIIHPAVSRKYQSWLKPLRHHPYTLKEAAILFESAAHQNLDAVIMVYAPEKIRIQRVILRDRITKREVENRMKNQWSDEEKIKRAQFVIYNDGHRMVLPQVLKTHKQLCKLAK